MNDALNKEIKVGDLVYYWHTDYFDQSTMYTGKVTKITPKTVKIDDGQGYHFPSEILRVESLSIVNRERLVGDMVLFKNGAGLNAGVIIELEAKYYIVSNVHLAGTNPRGSTNIRNVMANECMKVFDGKKSKIKYLKETNHV